MIWCTHRPALAQVRGRYNKEGAHISMPEILTATEIDRHRLEPSRREGRDG
jgi:hypothetical protein